MTTKAEYQRELRERAARQKRLDAIVGGAMARVTAQIAGQQPPICDKLFYGASAIHPRNLVAWYLFSTDAELSAAKACGLTADLDRLTRSELLAGTYPAQGVQLMKVSFASEEEIQRTTGGDRWSYFK